jgi:hypothetical protein
LSHDRRFTRAWTQAFSETPAAATFLSIALPGPANDAAVVRISKAAEIETGTDVMVLVVDLSYIAWTIIEAVRTLGPPAKPGVRPPQEEPPAPEEPPEEEIQAAAE